MSRQALHHAVKMILTSDERSSARQVAAASPLVQSKASTTADGSAGLTAVFNTPLLAGQSMFAVISYESHGGRSVSPTLVGGGGDALNQSVGNNGSNSVEIWYFHNVAGGETGVTFSTNDAVRANIQALVFTGCQNAGEEGTSTYAVLNSGTMLCNSVAPVSASNVIIAGWAYVDATNQYTGGPTHSFTRVGTGTGGATLRQECAYLVRSADASALDTTLSISAADDYISAGAAYGRT